MCIRDSHKWEAILKMPQPDPAMKTTTVFWHFARGLALAGTGRAAQALSLIHI